MFLKLSQPGAQKRLRRMENVAKPLWATGNRKLKLSVKHKS